MTNAVYLTPEQKRLEAIRRTIVERLGAGQFTRFPGNAKRAVVGVRWNMLGTHTFLLVYWQPVHDTFEPFPEQTDSIWRGTTQVNAWERYLGLTVPGTYEEAMAELNAVPSYFSRKQGRADNKFQVLLGDRSQPDPEQLLADRDAGDLHLEGFTDEELNWQ